MIRPGEKVFVDTGAWVALFERQDPLHERAFETWQALGHSGARLHTSLPVVIETFTFLDRRSTRELALAWRAALDQVPRLAVMECGLDDLRQAWPLLDRKDFHRLSLVDATSFVLMRRHKLRVAFAFDVHFGLAGFRYAA